MNDFITLVGIGLMISLPIVSVIGTPFLGAILWRRVGMREKELETRAIEARARILELERALPDFVGDDPESRAAWSRAMREVERAREVAGRRSASRPLAAPQPLVAKPVLAPEPERALTDATRLPVPG